MAQAEFLLPFNSLDPLLLPFGLPSCDKSFEIQRHRPMTKAIIFDLDSCLAAADEVVVVHRRLRRSPSAGATRMMVGLRVQMDHR